MPVPFGTLRLTLDAHAGRAPHVMHRRSLERDALQKIIAFCAEYGLEVAISSTASCSPPLVELAFSPLESDSALRVSPGDDDTGRGSIMTAGQRQPFSQCGSDGSSAGRTPSAISPATSARTTGGPGAGLARPAGALPHGAPCQR
jgi:hypothetical protein